MCFGNRTHVSFPKTHSTLFDKNLPMNHHHLGLGHFLDGVLGAFLAEAAVLEAAVGHEVGAPHGAPVDVQVAAVHLARETQGGIEVLR